MKLPQLSVVIPCCNEESTLDELLRRVTGAVNALALPAEILLVDDGSTDRTWEKMEALKKTDPRICAVKLARNYGHQTALSAGLSLCRATECVFVLDADLQDPPELLGEMLALMRQKNADVVYGQRTRRDGETVFKRASAKCFYRVLRFLTDVDIPADTGDFRLMKRRVVDALNAMPEHARFIRGMVSWTGGIQIALPYRREPRFAGKTKYPFRKMMKLAYDAIASFSTKPLKLGIHLGGTGVVIGLLVLLYSLFSYFSGRTVAGWTSTIAVIILLGSIQIFLLGVIGEYVGRIFIEAQHRPLYLVSQILRDESSDEDVKKQSF